jgi:Fe-S cluster assembly protein SufB
MYPRRQFGGRIYSIAVTNNFQQADTGTKMIHLGKTLNRPLFPKVFRRNALKIVIEV